MILSHRHKFIFVKTRKTGGTSLEVFLSDQCGSEDVFPPIRPPVDGHTPRNWQGLFNPLPDLQGCESINNWLVGLNWLRGRRFYNHMPASAIRARVGDQVWSEYRTFCVERHPYEKTLSHYYWVLKNRKKPISLDEYLEQGLHCRNASLYTDPHSGQIIVDRVLKYERLNEELGELFSELDIPYSGSLGVRAKGNARKDRRPAEEVLTEPQKAMVRQIYATEFELHGHEG